MYRHPAVQKAQAFLRARVESAVREGSERLPPIARLAAEAGVAQTTMWKAVRQLCDQGTLQAGPRRGTRIAGAVPEPQPPEPTAPTGQKWQRLCASVEADIANGVYPPGARLPSGQQLMEHYGVCFQTLKKSLLWLVGQGVLASRKKGYVVPQVDMVRNRATILFVSWVVGSEVLGALDSECSRAGIRLRILQLFPHDELLDGLRRARRGLSSDALLGYLVSITGGSPEQYREILNVLVPADKPIAVLDQTGGATGVPLPGGRSLRVFTIANSELPGLHVGRHLLSLGHRHVAYLSPAHQNVWSRRRLAGLRRAFAALGSSAHVSEYTRRHESVVRGSAAAVVAQEMESVIAGLRKGRSAVRRHLAAALERLQSDVGAQVEWSAMADELRPLMEQALADPRITAWVGANDTVAVLCQEFLRSRGMRVPEDISVVGFDDSTAAFSEDITSYNFNRPAAINAVISYLVGSATQRRRGGSRDVEVEGFVAPRASTGPAFTGGGRPASPGARQGTRTR